MAGTRPIVRRLLSHGAERFHTALCDTHIPHLHDVRVAERSHDSQLERLAHGGSLGSLTRLTANNLQSHGTQQECCRMQLRESIHINQIHTRSAATASHNEVRPAHRDCPGHPIALATLLQWSPY